MNIVKLFRGIINSIRYLISMCFNNINFIKILCILEILGLYIFIGDESILVKVIMYVIFSVICVLIVGVVTFIHNTKIVRLSNVLIYNGWSGKINGDIQNNKVYTTLDYDNDRNKVGQLYINEVIQGLLYNAEELKIKTLKARTHKFVIDNIVKSSQIQQMYNIKENNTYSKNRNMFIEMMPLIGFKISKLDRNYVRNLRKITLTLKS